MSACLFTYSNKRIIGMSEKQLKDAILEQEPYSLKYDPNNRFESNRAVGYADN